MIKEKKKYQVFEKIVTVNDFDEYTQVLPLGYTEAVSPEKAIANVKHQKGIKKRNYYEKDIYFCNVLEKHSFYAMEIEKENENENKKAT